MNEICPCFLFVFADIKNRYYGFIKNMGEYAWRDIEDKAASNTRYFLFSERLSYVRDEASGRENLDNDFRENGECQYSFFAA